MNHRHVFRVKSLKLCRFRGFVSISPAIIDTDADVVLLTGPNGFGKTSLIDALCLLLNGHYYAERRPLVSYTAADGNGFHYAQIEATVECAGSENDTRMVTVRDNQKDPPDISPPDSFCPNGISQELAARCSFYYQDLLSKLFEEEDAQVRLLEFLRPLPEPVSLVRDAVKKARGQWRELVSRELSNLAGEEGLPNESTLNEERKRAAAAFRDAWHDLVDIASAEGGIRLPGRTGDWLFLIKSDNLRSGWAGELRNLAADCLALLLPDRTQPAPDEKPSLSLRLIEESLLELRRKAIGRISEAEEKLRSLLEDLPGDTVLLPPHAWPAEEKDIAAALGRTRDLEAQVSFLERLERHFGNPGGPDLLTVLVALRDKGGDWLKVPDAATDFSPPPPVIEWLREAVSHDLTGLADQLEKWQSRVTARRLELVQHLSDLQKTIRDKKALLEKYRQIYELMQQDLRISHHFKALIDAGSPIFPAELKKLLRSTGAKDNLLTAIERVRAAVSQWIQVEELDEKRKVALQRRAGYMQVREMIDSITGALEREAGKNSVLNSAILPPDDVIRDLQHMVNGVLNRFRLVDGIYPVRFEARRDKRGKAGSSLQVYAADDRPLSALSTGQKAQLGLAMILGLNYSLNRYIGHNIIALDDVTTAFDMAQLPRTAALIRQIAYASGEASARRQVFIVSHHEDLTNRLLDFLIPPEGRKMRILNFVNWTPNNGPMIEQREVIAGLEASERNRKKFVETLKSICLAGY
ncbi:AAA family ATPase [Desulfofundulus thermosubterraneus]|uniref:Nuclease SbcCD subunit C n=1 Tax=Desulfofundulus thermosubterraneus DSM 16057 TaxID=1121432 RepID=A0A1M6LBV9_9FIRM|nr:AAA family ATPase [Desulfofundulus thermosubterraneus]SHJ68644.1 RecF/RecN/SMC N terminal domain-containing protein [Desulfofundulus thermosubterraneus DSM 16057]